MYCFWTYDILNKHVIKIYPVKLSLVVNRYSHMGRWTCMCRRAVQKMPAQLPNQSARSWRQVVRRWIVLSIRWM